MEETEIEHVDEKKTFLYKIKTRWNVMSGLTQTSFFISISNSVLAIIVTLFYCFEDYTWHLENPGVTGAEAFFGNSSDLILLFFFMFVYPLLALIGFITALIDVFREARKDLDTPLFASEALATSIVASVLGFLLPLGIVELYWQLF